MPSKTVFIILAVLALVGGGSYLALRQHVPRLDKSASASDSIDTHAHDGHAHEDHGEEKPATVADTHEHEKSDAHTEAKSHDDSVKIDPAAARALQINVLEAGSGTIRQTIDVTGRITLDQTTTAQVKARFPGIIRSVVKQPSDVVKAGDTLATVESNDSLQVYPVKSPVTGTVLTRTANIGELANDSALFVVADLSRLWVELFVFARDGDKIKAGQPVRVRRLDDTAAAEATLTLVLPTADPSSQTIVARATLPNAEGLWRAGMSVRASIAHAESNVTVAVQSQAIQRVEGVDVVFVQTADDTYQAQPIVLGISDGTWTEVRSGLAAGQRYVASNSFILKAEMGKAGAEHDH
ncbi:MAG: efflux RND transporter periplasmic adaptor subunit [Alphaproteobacteria bacterium]|nr:efflux RND transporter periplasmic adaptor subunit [Alphaproteobacteria bacterium]